MGSFAKRGTMTTVGPGQQVRKDRVIFNSFSINKPVIIYNAIPSSRFRDNYQLYRFEDTSTLRKMMYTFGCAPIKPIHCRKNFHSANIRFSKKDSAIVIDISGHLPILGNFPDTFELIDDTQEHSKIEEDSEGNKAQTQIIQSLEKHRDYDFTLHEYEKDGDTNKYLRKMHFTFNHDQTEIRLEYTDVKLYRNKHPMRFYFRLMENIELD